MIASWFMLAALSGLLGWAIVADVRHRRIPNRASLSIACLGIAFAVVAGGWPGLVLGVSAGLGGACLLLVIRRLLGAEAIGMGDVKLTAALGPWLGPMGLVLALLVACIALVTAAAIKRSRGPAPLAPFLAPAVLALAILSLAAGGPA